MAATRARDLRLQQIRIASPCGESWDSMRGDERMRHCDRCNLNVYNFAAMTAEEALVLLDSAGDRLCGRIFRRTDGTVLLRDCPVGLAAVRRKVVRGAALAVVLLLSTAAGIAGAAITRRGDDLSRWWWPRSLRDCRPFDAVARWAGVEDVRQAGWVAGAILCPPPPPITPDSLDDGIIGDLEYPWDEP